MTLELGPWVGWNIKCEWVEVLKCWWVLFMVGPKIYNMQNVLIIIFCCGLYLYNWLEVNFPEMAILH